MPFVLFGLVLAILVMLLFGGTEMDRGLLMLVANVDAPRLKDAAGAIEWAARPLALIGMTAAGLAWLLARRQWRPALLLLGVTLSGWVVVELIQQATAALRPGLEGRVLQSQVLGGFPNDEVARLTLVVLALTLTVTATRPARPILGTFGTFLVLAVGWSRILRGESWPSDVIAGWGVAIIWVLVPLRLAGHDIGDGAPGPPRLVPKEREPAESPLIDGTSRSDRSDLRVEEVGGPQ